MNINIKVNNDTRNVSVNRNFAGVQLENLQDKFVITFSGDFIDGAGQLEYSNDEGNFYVALVNESNQYTLDVSNILIKDEGTYPFQIKIINDEAVFKSKIFYLKVFPSINASEQEPTNPNWQSWVESYVSNDYIRKNTILNSISSLSTISSGFIKLTNGVASLVEDIRGSVFVDDEKFGISSTLSTSYHYTEDLDFVELGHNAFSGLDGIAIGSGAYAGKGIESFEHPAVGRNIAIGKNAKAYNDENIVIGHNSIAGDLHIIQCDNNILIGNNNNTYYRDNILIGSNISNLLSNDCILIGRDVENKSSGNNILIGRGAKVSCQNGIQLGSGENSNSMGLQVYDLVLSEQSLYKGHIPAVYLETSIDPSTFVMTISLVKKYFDNEEEIYKTMAYDTHTIDLPLEEMIVNGSYNNLTKSIVLTLKSGQTINIPVGDLISGLQTQSNILDSISLLPTNQTGLIKLTNGVASLETDYVTSSDLENYITQSDLADYITSDELDTILNDYVTSNSLNTTLSNYVTSTSLSNVLNSYVTSSSLSITLSSYVTSSSLSVTLSDYITHSDLTTELSDYVTSSALNTQLQNYQQQSNVLNSLSLLDSGDGFVYMSNGSAILKDILKGGSQGQVLAKKTNSDFDFEWINGGGGGGNGETDYSHLNFAQIMSGITELDFSGFIQDNPMNAFVFNIQLIDSNGNLISLTTAPLYVNKPIPDYEGMPIITYSGILETEDGSQYRVKTLGEFSGTYDLVDTSIVTEPQPGVQYYTYDDNEGRYVTWGGDSWTPGTNYYTLNDTSKTIIYIGRKPNGTNSWNYNPVDGEYVYEEVDTTQVPAPVSGTDYYEWDDNDEEFIQFTGSSWVADTKYYTRDTNQYEMAIMGAYHPMN